MDIIWLRIKSVVSDQNFFLDAHIDVVAIHFVILGRELWHDETLWLALGKHFAGGGK